MKKLFCALLAVFMLAASVIPAFAADEKELLYEKKFYEFTNGDVGFYDELYYHYDGTEIDWALIYGHGVWAGSSLSGVIICDRIINNTSWYHPFPAAYGIYDAQDDTFYDLAEIDESRYEGLDNALAELDLGTLIGDVDTDGKLTIKDATIIQRILVEYDMDELDFYDCFLDNYSLYDVNRDLFVSVKDVTELQKKLAGFV